VFESPSRLVTEPLIRAGLLEDLGRGGDLTSDAIVSPQQTARARIVARQSGIVAGLDAALLAFSLLDGAVAFDVAIADGGRIEAGQSAATVTGNARAILGGERTALNVLCRLSGIATVTRAMVDAVAGTRARVADTRKTMPGWRALEKYAVRCGGGSNHRFGLDDAVLIKDNHLALATSIHDAVAAVRARAGHMVRVEIEVDTLEQLHQALEEPIDAVLLDNMTPEQLTQAVAIVNGRAITEASGGVELRTIAAIARSGVDVITAGRITLGAPPLDFGVDFDERD
jgi:nicotinate-nucleotide pyrophosphorylase (carboxylating)